MNLIQEDIKIFQNIHRHHVIYSIGHKDDSYVINPSGFPLKIGTRINDDYSSRDKVETLNKVNVTIHTNKNNSVSLTTNKLLLIDQNGRPICY
jgi:hypothetical protein